MSKSNLQLSGSTQGSTSELVQKISMMRTISRQEKEEKERLNNPLYLLRNDDRFISLDILLDNESTSEDLDFD